MKIKTLMVVVASVAVTLAACSVDGTVDETGKATIRSGSQGLPSRDLIVENKGWLTHISCAGP